jgi:hypothetical protein
MSGLAQEITVVAIKTLNASAGAAYQKGALAAGCPPKFADVSSLTFTLKVDAVTDTVYYQLKDKDVHQLKPWEQTVVSLITGLCLQEGGLALLGLAGFGGPIGVFVAGTMAAAIPFVGGDEIMQAGAYLAQGLHNFADKYDFSGIAENAAFFNARRNNWTFTHTHEELARAFRDYTGPKVDDPDQCPMRIVTGMLGDFDPFSRRDPLVLDLNGDGIETRSLQAGAFFDHDADGCAEQTGWIAPDGRSAGDG